MSDGLPKGWTETAYGKLGRVVERITAGSRSSTSSGLSFQSNGIAVIKLRDLHNGLWKIIQ